MRKGMAIREKKFCGFDGYARRADRDCLGETTHSHLGWNQRRVLSQKMRDLFFCILGVKSALKHNSRFPEGITGRMGGFPLTRETFAFMRAEEEF